MTTSPASERIHIGLFGRCNSGKSSLLNALTGQHAALVSETPGTTTDPVVKAIELPGIGAVALTDTAGFDDRSALGDLRLAQTRRIAGRCDIAVLVFTGAEEGPESQWVAGFRERGIPLVAVLNRSDEMPDVQAAAEAIEAQFGLRPVVVSAKTGAGMDLLVAALAAAADRDDASLTDGLAEAGDVVLLVMPQDGSAPRGRLILPQAQTLRELLDKGCVAVCCTPAGMQKCLDILVRPPKLVITDSQAFAAVSPLVPAQSLLTSFSVLYAGYKGDLRLFVEGAGAIGRLTENSRVLIAEACTHVPAAEDIGRVKLPRLLRAKAGAGLRIDTVSGADFPHDLRPYDLVIHCGGCMFRRRHVLARVGRAAAQGVPVTNYGVAIAALTGILDRIAYPGKTPDL